MWQALFKKFQLLRNALSQFWEEVDDSWQVDWYDVVYSHDSRTVLTESLISIYSCSLTRMTCKGCKTTNLMSLELEFASNIPGSGKSSQNLSNSQISAPPFPISFCDNWKQHQIPLVKQIYLNGQFCLQNEIIYSQRILHSHLTFWYLELLCPVPTRAMSTRWLTSSSLQVLWPQPAGLATRLV